MLAARLHGPADLRIEQIPHPGAPTDDEALIKITATGICGSDLHAYKDARVGDIVLPLPLILGHEFAGIVVESATLKPGTRVAVDPAQHCGHCDMCERGHPNLCRHIHFCGMPPDDGSLREFMRVAVSRCFPIPDSLDDAAAVMLEPLGVALHTTDLAKIRLGDRVAVLGAGCIGLSIIQTAKLAGASEVFVTEPLPWRLELAKKLGATPLPANTEVDIVIEAAWGGDAANLALDIVRPGGRVVLVGIPEEDRLELKHSVARRKGLTIKMARRMKHVYPRAIRLVAERRVDVHSLITHRFPLAHAAEAFALNLAYRDGVVKVLIENAYP